MVSYLVDGIGASLGDSLAMETGFIGTPTVYYVSSVSGSNYYTGRDRAKPVATLSYAIGLATAGDIIVLLSDHTETISSLVTVNKELLIIGEGSSEGKPTASVWGGTPGSDEVIAVTANRVEIRNVRFRPHTLANTGNFINWTGTDAVMKGCYLESDQFDDGPKLLVGGDRMTIESTTFISVATNVANQPVQAIATTSGALTIFRMKNSVISGGAYGWSSADTAAYFQASALQVRIEGLSLLLGSDIKLDADVTGFVSVPVSTGGSQVRWP